MVDSYRDTDSSKHMVRKRLRNTDSSEHTEGNLEPQTKKKKVAAATKKTQTRKRTDQNTMRSTLDGVLKFLKEEKKSISTEHNAVLKKTLFYGFFKLCYEEKIIWQIRNKSCSSIRKILELYNAETSIAKIAGELIALTAEDVSLLFGFPAKGECIVPVARHECPDPNDPFIQRYFSTTPKSVTKRMIEDAVKSSLTEYKNNVADFPRLWILHTLVAFFFDNGAATIPWGYFTHIICLDNLETVSWAESVRKILNIQLQKIRGDFKNVKGCVLLLEVVPPVEEYDQDYQRLARWNILDIQEKINEIDLDAIPKQKVQISVVHSNDREKDLLEKEALEKKHMNQTHQQTTRICLQIALPTIHPIH